MTSINLTPKQQFIVDSAVKWYYDSSEQVFQFSGNPGTGKSVVMNAIIDALAIAKHRVAPMAYVGAAAINMRLKGMENAKTIHSWIYDFVEVPKVDSNGEVVINPHFDRPEVVLKQVLKDLDDIDLIAIDEGGMVPLKMKDDILSRGKKVLVAGDLDQLPPVADAPAFLNDGKVYVLDEIMRQAKNSAIINLCQRAKQGLPIHTGFYNEVIVMEESEFMKIAPQVLPTAEMILCGKNETREKYTNMIRYELLGKKSNMPDFGEKLICRANDWTMEAGGINLTNGLVGNLMNQPDPSSFDGTCFYIDFMPTLEGGYPTVPFVNVPVDYEYFTTEFSKRKQMKNFRYYTGEAFEFGYVQTVHVAQGSQRKNGIYFEEYMPMDMNKLNYTALSRFSEKCIYVKKNRKLW